MHRNRPRKCRQYDPTLPPLILSTSLACAKSDRPWSATNATARGGSSSSACQWLGSGSWPAPVWRGLCPAIHPKPAGLVAKASILRVPAARCAPAPTRSPHTLCTDHTLIARRSTGDTGRGRGPPAPGPGGVLPRDGVGLVPCLVRRCNAPTHTPMPRRLPPPPPLSGVYGYPTRTHDTNPARWPTQRTHATCLATPERARPLHPGTQSRWGRSSARPQPAGARAMYMWQGRSPLECHRVLRPMPGGSARHTRGP